MLFINTSKIRESTVGSSFTVTYSANPESVEELKALHSTYSSVNMSEFTIKPQADEEYINNLPWTEAGNGEQTDIEIARAIVHKAIDDTFIAEDAYPDLRQKMHDAVDNYEPQTERSE